MNRKMLLEMEEIFKIYENAPNKSTLDKRLREIGKQIESERKARKQKKINFILAKGENMTRTDIEWLLGNEVGHNRIKTHLKIGTQALNEYMERHGFADASRQRINWSKQEIEIVKRLGQEGKTIKEIAFELNRSYATVHSMIVRKNIKVKRLIKRE